VDGTWDEIADWWLSEGHADIAYQEDVLPLLDRLLSDGSGIVADLGCGEGQALRHVLTENPGVRMLGCDLSEQLLQRARRSAPVVRARLPELRWLGDQVLDGALSIYLLDLVPDEQTFFAETARVTRLGGFLIVIMNHPAYTAPGASPLLDVDGEVLWRWGSYFSRGSSTEPAGAGTITFHHRPLSSVLNAAAGAGWFLESMEELPLSEVVTAEHPTYQGQEHVPRLLGVRWRRGRPLKFADTEAD
jgi:SAM-dependent methyltransferase